jgi:hypothetical protein
VDWRPSEGSWAGWAPGGLAFDLHSHLSPALFLGIMNGPQHGPYLRVHEAGVFRFIVSWSAFSERFSDPESQPRWPPAGNGTTLDQRRIDPPARAFRRNRWPILPS